MYQLLPLANYFWNTRKIRTDKERNKKNFFKLIQYENKIYYDKKHNVVLLNQILGKLQNKEVSLEILEWPHTDI